MSKKLPAVVLPTFFEKVMVELEQLVVRMEAGELPLEVSVTAYKLGS